MDFNCTNSKRWTEYILQKYDSNYYKTLTTHMYKYGANIRINKFSHININAINVK